MLTRREMMIDKAVTEAVIEQVNSAGGPWSSNPYESLRVTLRHWWKFRKRIPLQAIRLRFRASS